MKFVHGQSGTDIRVILASGSRFFLRGLCGILEDAGGINVVAQASSYKEVEEYLVKTEADFLFVDNQTLKLCISEVSGLITKITHSTKIICLDNSGTEELISSNIIYLAKETGSSELITVIRGRRLSRFVSTRNSRKSSTAECGFPRKKAKK